MTDAIDRRTFIAKSAAAGLGVGVWGAFPGLRRPVAPSDRILVGVMGVNSRGSELANGFARAGAEVAYICDVDSRAIDTAIAALSDWQERRPEGVTDFRRALDDNALDALVIAAPDHWHAPASILALRAGKHVYVEKPCGHNPREGELLVEAQRRYGRLVQMGNQQRSAP